jgi:hypothetical protein
VIVPCTLLRVMPALAAALWIGAGVPAALAQSYSADGQVGYLQEWEMKASLARTVTSSGVAYDGPVTLRHVGLCSVNGVEEKSGMVRLQVSPKTAGIEGTLAMKDDSCRIVAAAQPSYSGLLSCRDGQGVPIKFSIRQAEAADGSDAGIAK